MGRSAKSVLLKTSVFIVANVSVSTGCNKSITNKVLQTYLPLFPPTAKSDTGGIMFVASFGR